MHDILIHALAERVKAGMMTVEEVPEIFKAEVENLISAIE
jgi:hypothetical protein